ncbi:MAG: hypothetical protein OER56_00195 [Hyphomicrobiales bacterium]|nr:hypothetical protein [Hyphomicrobiales bacterium]
MIDRRIKFRHIQCLVEICRKKNFKLAAEKLLLEAGAGIDANQGSGYWLGEDTGINPTGDKRCLSKQSWCH